MDDTTIAAEIVRVRNLVQRGGFLEVCEQAGDTVMRLHQEDLAQALGVSVAAKYEVAGGPGMLGVIDVVGAMGAFDADRRHSLQLFTQAVVFNLLAAGIDAHSKNYSLLYLGRRARLAPLYDLNSAFLLLPGTEVVRRRTLAMRYGNTYSMYRLSGRNLARTADTLLVDRDAFRQGVRDAGSVIVDAFRAVQNALPPDLRVRMPIHDFAPAMAAHVRQVMAAAETIPSYREFAMERSNPRIRSDVTRWASGHWNSDSWVEDHARRR